MGNLGKRVATAVVLIPLVVFAILELPSLWLGGALGAIALAGLWEWTALAGWTARPGLRWGYLLVSVGLMVLATAAPEEHLVQVAGLGLGWWLVAFAGVIAYQCGVSVTGRWSSPVWAMFGWLVVIPAWCAVLAVHRDGTQGPWLVLALMVIIWMADIGAYFAGRRFGQRKLASRVSPGKSWEGAAGGAVAALLAAAAFVPLLGAGKAAGFMLVAAVTIVVSVFGDLTESLFKRLSGTKDSGSLLPGHGGVLDRIDSLTAAAPFFAIGVLLTGVST